MKRLFLTICLLATCILVVNAQEKPDANKMVQERVSYMKDNLKLTSAESKSFWTAYEQYLRSEIKYHDTYRSNLSKQGIKGHGPHQASSAGKQDELTDKQITYLYDQRMELKKNLYTLESGFYKKIKPMLTPKHLRDFYTLDEKYKRSMVNKKKESAPAAPATQGGTPNKKRR